MTFAYLPVYHVFPVYYKNKKFCSKTCNHSVVPDNTVHGANMGPIWGRQDPGGPHIGPMNRAILGVIPARPSMAVYCMKHSNEIRRT